MDAASINYISWYLHILLINMYLFRSLVDFVTMAMDYYTEIREIQYSCSAILANLIKLNKGILNEESNLIHITKEKQQKIITILVKVINYHQLDPVILKNNLLTLQLLDVSKTCKVTQKYRYLFTFFYLF